MHIKIVFCYYFYILVFVVRPSSIWILPRLAVFYTFYLNKISFYRSCFSVFLEGLSLLQMNLISIHFQIKVSEFQFFISLKLSTTERGNVF
jgi:hypothetical protein